LKWLYDLSVISIQRTREKKVLLAAQERAVEEYVQYANRVDNALKQFGLDLGSMGDEAQAAVDEIVELGLEVNVDPLTATWFDIAKAMSDRIDEEFEVEQREQQLTSLTESLEKRLSELKDLEARLETGKKQIESEEDTMDEMLAEWMRNTKLNQAKIEQYNSQQSSRKVREFIIHLLMTGYSRRTEDN